jgi:hypothetical protein
LKDPRWQKKRLEILSRDEFTCQFCRDTESTLHVHHLAYVYGRNPWEYENYYLLTLCESCHEFEHERPDIEKKLLTQLKMAGISAEWVDFIACPSSFGAQNYRRLWEIFGVLVNPELYSMDSLNDFLDTLKTMLMAHKGIAKAEGENGPSA